MGGAVAKIFFKSGKDTFQQSSYNSLHDIPSVDIDGKEIARIGDIIECKKCILVINVSSK